jgi:hypothetical protein
MAQVLDTQTGKTLTLASDQQNEQRRNFVNTFKENPLPDTEMLTNLGLFMNRQSLSRVLAMHELYKKIIKVHGVIMELGVRWGQNLALFESFRGMYEPYNFSRKVIGFDTFAGFPSVAHEDGTSKIIEKGAYGVTDNYEKYLDKVLQYHESESPLPHIKKYELVKGDASKTVPEYLAKHQETVIALAYFDFDIYEPTKVCLNAIKPYLVKGSVIGFDELNWDVFPGETVAFREVLGGMNYRLIRSPLLPFQSHIVIE